jgi:hypothetical protein
MAIEDIKTSDDAAQEGAGTNDVISLNDYKDLTITDDNRSVLTEAGIAGFDKSGNAVNDKGEVILATGAYQKEDFEKLSKDDFTTKYFEAAEGGTGDGTGTGDQPNGVKPEELVEGVELIIAEKEYKIDADGNAVHADGTKIEKDKLLEMLKENVQQPTLSDDVIADIAKVDGYDLQDENGNPLTFDATPEGIAKRTQYIVENEVAKRTENVVQDFLSKTPELNSAFQYLRTHGSLEGFANHVDYATVTLDKDDKQQLRELVISDMVGVGKSRQEAEDYAKFVEANNKLFDTADLVLKKKQEAQIKEQADADAREAKQREDAERYFQEVQDKAKAVVTDGKILDYQLPLNLRIKGDDGTIKTVPRAEFEKYLFEPVTPEGYTMAQVKRMEYNKSIDNLIFDDLLMFLGMDTNQLTLAKKEDGRIQTIIKRKQDNQNAQTIRLKPKTSPIDDIK